MIKNLLQNNHEFAIGSLLYLYSLQTDEEKKLDYTKERNNCGFNMIDSTFLSNLSLFFSKHGYLTERQLIKLHKCIAKYHKQIEKQCIWTKGKRHTPVTRFQQYPIILSNKKSEKNPKIASLFVNKIKIRFQYDPSIVQQIKSIPQRRWNPEDKFWTCPLSISNIEILEQFGFDIDEKLKNWKAETNENELKIDSINSIPGLLKQPYKYQLDGIKFLERKSGKALIADEMGLGKTLQALGYLQIHPEIRPAVIIVPASLKLNWEKEIRETLGSKKNTVILNGKTPNGDSAKAKAADIIIINYSILAGWSNFLIEEIQPQCVIIDESQYIKNSKTIRSKEVKRICKRAKSIIELTGTPIKNRTKEIYNQVALLDPTIFPNFVRFGIEYCNGHQTNFGWDFNGSSNNEKLHKILSSTIMVRREKKEVLPDLPKKIRAIVPMQITNEAQYNSALKEFKKWLRGTTKIKKEINGKSIWVERKNADNPAVAMVEMEKLKQAAVRGKMDSCINWIKNFLDSGEKLVIFATHQSTLDRLQKEFPSISVKLDGRTSIQKRQKAVDEFQKESTIKLFLGNIKAAGVGITLTAASNTCFLELDWNPMDHTQAEDRVHRIGQKSDSVNAWYLIARNTVEEKIAKLLDKKAAIISDVIDGKKTDPSNLISELLKANI